MDWVTYRQQKFVSYSSGGREVQDQGTGEFGAWGEAASWFIDGHVSDVTSHAESGRSSLISLIRTPTAPMRAPPSGLNYLPKALPPSTISMRVRIQHMNFGSRGHSHSVSSTKQSIHYFCDYTHLKIKYGHNYWTNTAISDILLFSIFQPFHSSLLSHRAFSTFFFLIVYLPPWHFNAMHILYTSVCTLVL